MYPCLSRYLNVLTTQRGTGRKKPPRQKSQFDPSSFDRTPTVTDTDGRTDRHRATTSTRASAGKNTTNVLRLERASQQHNRQQQQHSVLTHLASYNSTTSAHCIKENKW